ncbi:MAG: hypothetical protein ACOX0Z_01480 [Candidatus Nanosyncoccaceae bacterium]|jgi:hypothetical protein
MDWRHLLMLVTSAAQIVGIVVYIVEMVKGKAKPHIISWMLWTAWPLIAFAAAASQGVTWAAVPALISGLVSLSVVIAQLLLKQADWNIRLFDYFCGGLALAALALWLVTDEPNLALAISIIGDLAGATPTIIKSWQFPESESALAYAICGFNSLTSFLFVTRWGFEEIAYPTYSILFNSLIVFSTVIRPKLKSGERLTNKAKT